MEMLLLLLFFISSSLLSHTYIMHKQTHKAYSLLWALLQPKIRKSALAADTILLLGQLAEFTFTWDQKIPRDHKSISKL